MGTKYSVLEKVEDVAPIGWVRKLLKKHLIKRPFRRPRRRWKNILTCRSMLEWVRNGLNCFISKD
jgi:hypothetical protein